MYHTLEKTFHLYVASVCYIVHLRASKDSQHVLYSAMNEWSIFQLLPEVIEKTIDVYNQSDQIVFLYALHCFPYSNIRRS